MSLETHFTWIIKDFDVCPQSPGERLTSPVFSVDSHKITLFCLHLYPRGYKDNEGCISLYLRRLNDDGHCFVNLLYEFCLIDASGKCNSFQKSEGPFFKNTSKGSLRFYGRDLLFGPLRSRFLPENKLTVQCRLLALISTENQLTSNQYFLYNPKEHKKLSHDLGELLRSGIHSDLTIFVDGNKEFKVHRALLESRCPELLKQLFICKDSNRFYLPFIQAEVLQALLTYFYTGRPSETSMFEEMLGAIHRFSLSNLKSTFFSSPESITAVTSMQVYQVTCAWPIQNFRVLKVGKECCFLLAADAMPQWTCMKLSLTKVRYSVSHRYWLHFDGFCKNEDTFMHCNVQIQNEASELRPLNDYFHKFVGNGRFSVQIDLHKGWVDGMLVNGELKLLVTARMSARGQLSALTEVKEMFLNVSFQRKCNGVVVGESEIFQEDLLNFYRGMKHADLILCVGGVKMPAHKLILCSRSEVFSKMFLHDTLERRTNIVHIKGVDAKTMASLLMYMYCGDIDGMLLTLSSAWKIYFAADRYQLLGLRSKCREYLKSHISPDTNYKKSKKEYIDDYWEQVKRLHMAEIAEGPEVVENGSEVTKAVKRRRKRRKVLRKRRKEIDSFVRIRLD